VGVSLLMWVSGTHIGKTSATLILHDERLPIIARHKRDIDMKGNLAGFFRICAYLC
jgi:hypothetical protein